MAVLLMITAAMVQSAGASEGPAVNENRVKALFVVNFAKYVEWPAHAPAAKDGPIVIGVLGPCEVAEELQGIAKTATIGGRPVSVRVHGPADDTTGSHVLFVPASQSDRIDALLSRLQGTPLLTVSDSDKFAARGGIIGLARREDRIRPQINLGAAERVGLKVSSKLLGVSDVLGQDRKK